MSVPIQVPMPGPHQSVQFVGYITSTDPNESVRRERDALLIENAELKQRIISLNATAEQLTNTLRRDREEIVLLWKENAELKQALAQLTLEIEQLKGENQAIKAENQQIKVDNQAIRAENQELRRDIQFLKNKDLVAKLMIAIQDLNSDDRLETHLGKGLKNNLIKLRNQRNMDCHYIDNDDLDGQELADFKKQLILKNLKEASAIVKRKIERTCGQGLFNGLIKYLENTLHDTQDDQGKWIDDEERELAEEWWTD